MVNSYTKIHSDYGVIANYNTIVKTYSDGSKKLVYTSYDKLKGIQRVSKKHGQSSQEDLERYKYLLLYT